MSGLSNSATLIAIRAELLYTLTCYVQELYWALATVKVTVGARVLRKMDFFYIISSPIS